MRVRRSKYGNVKAQVDGYTFDSKAEARRYQELRLLEQAGEVWDVEVHPRYPLYAPSTSGYATRAAHALSRKGVFRIGEYRADFKYRDRHTMPYVVEDVKGFDTPLSRWKRKHAEAQYGITIEVIR